MPEESSWALAEFEKEGQRQLVRVNCDERTLAEPGESTKMIVFETIPEEAAEIDGYLASLDQLEDAIKQRMEAIEVCRMLMSLTGAGFRDLYFAYNRSDSSFDEPIRSLMQAFPGRMNVRVEKPAWNVYRRTVAAVTAKE